MKASSVWEGESNFLPRGVLSGCWDRRRRGASYCSKPEQ